MKMNILRVKFRDTMTGDQGWYEQSTRAETDDERESLKFYWTDGNAGCDCERARMLAEATGKPDPNVSCGDSRIVILEATIDDQPFPEIVDNLA